jgi:hypothetical protein
MYFNYFLKGRVFLKIFLYTRLEGVLLKIINIKYIGSFYNNYIFSPFPRCEVGIQELPKNSALGRLRGSDNVVNFFY